MYLRIKGDGDGSVTVNSLAYCSRYKEKDRDEGIVFMFQYYC